MQNTRWCAVRIPRHLYDPVFPARKERAIHRGIAPSERSFLIVSAGYLGKQNHLPWTCAGVTTMNEPLLVRATALMLVLPNFLHSTFLQVVGVAVRVLKLVFVALAQRATWEVVTVWMTPPLLIQLANVFSVVGLGRPCLAGPCVWLYRVLYEMILFENSLLQRFQAVGTLVVGPTFPLFLLYVRPRFVLVPPQLLLPDRPVKAEEVPEVVRVREPLRPLTLVAIVCISKRYSDCCRIPDVRVIGTRGAPLEITT